MRQKAAQEMLLGQGISVDEFYGEACDSSGDMARNWATRKTG